MGQAQVVGEPQRQCEHDEHVGHGQVEQVETQGLAQAPAAADEHCQGRHVGRHPQARHQGVGCGHHNEASRVAPGAAAASTNTQVPSAAVHLGPWANKRKRGHHGG